LLDPSQYRSAPETPQRCRVRSLAGSAFGVCEWHGIVKKKASELKEIFVSIVRNTKVKSQSPKR